jgi:hypothetical protein
MPNLITLVFGFLDVRASPISHHTTLTNMNLDPPVACFLDVATCTTVSNVWTLLNVTFTFLAMSSLMKMYLGSLPCIHLLVLATILKSCSIHWEY